MIRSEVNMVGSKLSLLALAMMGAILASSVLITGDSTTVSSGTTLPQILLILATSVVAGLAGWQVLPCRRPISIPAVLLVLAVLCLVVSTVSATLRADGRAAWINLWHVMALLMMALLAAQVTHRPALSRALLQMVVVCAVFQSTYALYQYFVSMPAARAEYLADPDAAIRKAQIDAPPGSELRTQYENRLLGSFEPAGTFVLANSLAVLLSGVVVALGLMVLPGRTLSSHAKSHPERSIATVLSYWFARLAWLLIVAVWLLTKSRSGVLAVLVVGACVLTFKRMGWRSSTGVSNVETQKVRGAGMRWLIAAIFVIALIGAAIGMLSSDRLVLSEASKSLLYRLEYWKATSKMIMDFPLTGVGLGNFQSYYPAYKLPAASEVIADPHNWLFDLAVNCSLPLLVVALLGLAWTLRCAMMNARLAVSDLPVTMDVIDRAGIKALWIGGLASFAIVGSLQLVMGMLVDFDATMLAFFVALFMWWWLRVVPGTDQAVRRAGLLAVITMLVALLASGCWQASGLALPLAVLLAIGCPSQQPALVSTWKDRAVGAHLALALSVTALLGFVWQTWQPVHASWALEQQAMVAWEQGQAASAMALAKDAIGADRLSTTPRRLLVQFAMEQALSAARRASPADFTAATLQVDAAIEDLLLADSVSNLNYAYAGECDLALAAGCVSWNQQVALSRVKQAAEHYGEAIKRYPTNAALRAQAAVVQAWLDLGSGGKLSEAAQMQLAEAFRLSELTPHSNRKLAAQQVFLPPPLADPFVASAIARPNPGSPWVQAEPLCEFLRKL